LQKRSVILKLQVSFAKEPYKRDDIVQNRPIILRSLLIVATSYATLCDVSIELTFEKLKNPNPQP